VIPKPNTLSAIEDSRLLFSHTEIENSLNILADLITADMKDLEPLCLVVMVGGVVFAGQLLPKLTFPLEVDYLHATRYRGALKGADAVHWLAKPNTSLKDRHILILDDILDEGVTLSEVIKFCYGHGAASVKTAVLLDKQVTRAEAGLVKADYHALEAPNLYLFGYGLDYKEFWRNAPGIYALNT
jgi:hypoxanthine phosphoribosyltransferase